MSKTDKLRELVVALSEDELDLPFWQACRRDEWMLHRCGLCDRWYWPASQCIEHGGRAMIWTKASGRGTVHVYTILHRAYTPAMADKVPYNVAVIKLDEGPFFHSNVIDCPPHEMRSGLRVEVVFEDDASGFRLPRFKVITGGIGGSTPSPGYPPPLERWWLRRD